MIFICYIFLANSLSLPFAHSAAVILLFSFPYFCQLLFYFYSSFILFFTFLYNIQNYIVTPTPLVPSVCVISVRSTAYISIHFTSFSPTILISLLLARATPSPSHSRSVLLSRIFHPVISSFAHAPSSFSLLHLSSRSSPSLILVSNIIRGSLLTLSSFTRFSLCYVHPTLTYPPSHSHASPSISFALSLPLHSHSLHSLALSLPFSLSLSLLFRGPFSSATHYLRPSHRYRVNPSLFSAFLF